jgi:hypothetical protein
VVPAGGEVALSLVLALDADFVVTRELLDRISREIDTLSEAIGRGCARPDTSDLVDFRFLVDRGQD